MLKSELEPSSSELEALPYVMSLQYHADFALADPANLRMCEALLRKLPERVPTVARNPIWVFLKGIEGFDNNRAGECLVRLLDKHYDSISLLKLATKQDLVHYAGILPGDALRIVAAAKVYNVPSGLPDSGLSKSPQYDASKPGDVVLSNTQRAVSEHRQNAYVPPALREKFVNFRSPMTSESILHSYFPPVVTEAKEAKVVAHEPLKIEGQDAVIQTSPKKDPAKELVKVVNQAGINQDDVKEAAVSAQTITVGLSHPHTCGVCDVKCSSETDIRSHFNGLRHAKAMELATNSDDNSPTTYLYCSVWDFSV